MIFLLLILFILLLFLSYILFDRDYMAPSFIFCGVYIISISSALINYKTWGLSNYSLITFWILLSGAIIFIFIGFLVKRLIFNDSSYSILEINSLPSVQDNFFVSILLIIFNVIVLYLTIKNVRLIGGGGSWEQIVENYRAITSYSTDPSMTLPGYLLQFQKITTVCAYIYPFILIYNMTKKSAQKKDYFFTICNVGIFIVLSIVTSNRLNILGIVGTILVYYFVLNKKNNNVGSLKLLIRIIIVFIILIIIFYSIRLLVGRSGSANTGFVDYITLYIGGPVKLFDMFIKDPIHDASIWGEETFISLIGTIRDFGANIPVYLQHKEFRIYNGIDLGNVYSAYRNWYSDFGITGVIILQSIFSLFFNVYYYLLLRKKNYLRHPVSFIIYGYLAEAIFLHPIEDWFFSMDVSIGFLTYLVLFNIMFLLITKKIKI